MTNNFDTQGIDYKAPSGRNVRINGVREIVLAGFSVAQPKILPKRNQLIQSQL